MEIKAKNIYMREDIGLCTYEKHHKQKIILFLSAMRSYRDELKKNKFKIKYQELNTEESDSYIAYLYEYLQKTKINKISIWTIEDKWFEKELRKLERKGIDITVHETPMFLTKITEFNEKLKNTNFEFI